MLIPVSATLLSLAVAGGLTMGILHMRHVRVPFAAGLGHASLAIAGIVVLAFGVIQESQPAAIRCALRWPRSEVFLFFCSACRASRRPDS